MKLYFTSPAQYWQEGFPVGNGRLGAMVYGDPDRETLQINEDTLWTGHPDSGQTGMSAGDIEAVKELTGAGKYREAMYLLEERMKETEDVQMYVPFGNLQLEFTGERIITDYQRSLDLEDAVVRIDYKNSGVCYRHTCFCSAPANLLIYEIEAQEQFTLRIYGTGAFLTEMDYQEDAFTLRGECPGRNGLTKGMPAGEGRRQERYEEAHRRGMHYIGHGKVLCEGGRAEHDESGICCRNVRRVRILLAVRSSFAGFDRHPWLEGVDPREKLKQDLEQASLPVEQLFEEHIRDYQGYYGRVTFSLEHDTNAEETDLHERLKALEKYSYDPYLTALLFHYGRYLLISSSRPGTQAANLQGIWNQELIPPWFSDYTVNINTQMNYWLTGPCNLPELLGPYVDLCRELLENGRKTAKQFYGKEGSVCFHNVDVWRKTSPADGRAMWAYWPAGGGWLCRNLFDAYLFTQDKKYLESIMPILRENVLFFIQMLEETEEGLAVCPATSPENEFVCEGEAVSVAHYSENVHAVIRSLFRDYMEACRELGRSDEVMKEAARLLPQIVPVRLGRVGQILEWNEELPEADIRHRHLSHLYELHPGRGITRETPGLFQAARVSLNRRGFVGGGWVAAWRISMWARLEDGERAARAMKNLFHYLPAQPAVDPQPGLYPNLLCGPPYQIDGNLGYTAGVCEMLLQSHGEELVLLPALPEEWTSGTVSGLMARGNITVSISWDVERIRYTIKSGSDRKLRVRIGDLEAAVRNLRAGACLEGEVKKERAVKE